MNRELIQIPRIKIQKHSSKSSFEFGHFGPKVQFYYSLLYTQHLYTHQPCFILLSKIILFKKWLKI